MTDTLADYQLLPELSEAEYSALRDDIVRRGVQVPVEVDEDGAILDGHHRAAIATELGIEYPRTIRVGLSEDEKVAHVLALNLARRHLSAEQRRQLVADLRQRGWSKRRVAELLGVDEWTIRADCSRAGIPAPDRTVGKDGKSYPSRRPSITVHSRSDEDRARRAAEIAGEQLPAEPLDLRQAERVARETTRPKPRPQPPRQPTGVFSVAYVDPPWRYEHAEPSRAVENQYPTLSLDEIKALPEGPTFPVLADDAVLFLWATSPKLSQALEVMESWGFEYRTCMVWVKDQIGMGYYARQQHELLLIGRRGDPPVPEPANRPGSVLRAPRTRHSAKPPEFYALIDRMYPEWAKVELFARGAVPDGWQGWGDQAL